MKLNEIKEVGFYAADLKNREVIYEVLENTDEVWLKEEPDETLLIDEWTYTGIDAHDRKVYECLGGNLIGVKFADNIDVVKITDVDYTTPYGNSGTIIREDKPTYKELLKELIEKDIGTICDLKQIYERITFNGVECDSLECIIRDFEKDIREYEDKVGGK